MAATPADGAKLYVTIVKIYKMMNHILEHQCQCKLQAAGRQVIGNNCEDLQSDTIWKQTDFSS